MKRSLFLGVVLLVILGLLAFGKVLTYDFAAWDTYPLIAAGRADIDGLLLSRLMGPYFPYGDYYRPIVHLSFALDYALWGLQPLGYHLTDVILHLLNAILLLCLIRRFLPGSRSVAAVGGAMVLLLHPSVVAVVPVIARRHDMLAAAFTMGSLLCLTRPRRSRVALVFGLLLGLGAMGSKESALGFPVLFAAWVALASPARSVGARFRGVLVRSWPLFMVAAGFFAVRSGVLGGLGGVAPDAAAPPWLVRGPVMLTGLLGNLFFPMPNRAGQDWAGLLVPAGFVLLAYAMSRVALWRGNPERRQVGLFALVWLGLLLGLQLPLGSTPLRLTYIPLIPFSILVAAALDDLVSSVANRDRAGSKTETVWGAIPVALWLSFLVLSPLFQSYGDPWRDAGRMSRRVIDLVDTHVSALPRGATLTLNRLPVLVRYDPDRFPVAVAFAPVLAGYSIQAWADLRYPGKGVKVDVQTRLRLSAPVRAEAIRLAEPGSGDELRFELESP